MSNSNSQSYIDKILINPKKFNPYSHMKSAIKDSNFFYKNCITYNMVENLTQFKNKEINSTSLNMRLLSNLSFLFAKNKINIKINKNKDHQITKKNKKKIYIKENIFNLLDGYECFIPIKRIPYFNRKPINEKNSHRKENLRNFRRNHNKENKTTKIIKIPPNLRTINFFRPCGRFIIPHTNTNSKTIPRRKKSSLSISKSSDDYSADDLSSSLTYSNNNDDGNDRNNSSSDYSLICGEPDNIFQEKEFMNLLRTSTTFPKYAELNDLIECPFEDAFPPEMRLKNYLNILDEFLNYEDYEEINNNINTKTNVNNNIINNNTNNTTNNNINSNLNIDLSYNTTFLSNQENSIINLSNDTSEDANINNITENDKKLFITNPSNNKLDINIKEKNKLPRKSSISGKLMKVNSNIFGNNTSINKTSLSDDNEIEGYKKDESIFSFFENEEKKSKNPSKKIDSKIKKILPKSFTKYINHMNNQYIFLMYDQFKPILNKYNEAKNFLKDELMLKKLFIQMLKIFLLNMGISKKLYEKLIKYEIYNKDILNFEHFMNLFELILIEKNKEYLRFKFLLLLKILCTNDDSEEILDEKKMDIFFDLIGCEYVYINNLCELLGERLILRYKAIYNNEIVDKNNVDRVFIYRKIKIILESFLDVLDM